MTALEQIKCLKQRLFPRCAPISELPSIISTMALIMAARVVEPDSFFTDPDPKCDLDPMHWDKMMPRILYIFVVEVGIIVQKKHQKLVI